MSLWEMSLRGGLFILAVALVRLVLAYRLPRRVYLLLWALAAALLLVPLRIAAPSSVYNLLPRQQAEEASIAAPAAEIAPVQSVVPTSAPSGERLPAPVSADEAPVKPANWLLLCYWIGAGLCGALLLLLHLRNLRRFRAALPVENCPIPLPRRVRLRSLAGLSSPLSYGLLRPVILLPESTDFTNKQRLRHIVTHELYHIRSFDLQKKLVLLFTAVVHWFNPAVWLMVCLCSQDLEMRCDADVLRRLGSGERLAYARTLVATEEARLGGLLQIGFSYSSTGSRLKLLAKKPPRPILSVLASALTVTLLLALFATGRMSASAESGEAEAAPPIVTTAARETEAPRQASPSEPALRDEFPVADPLLSEPEPEETSAAAETSEKPAPVSETAQNPSPETTTEPAPLPSAAQPPEGQRSDDPDAVNGLFVVDQSTAVVMTVGRRMQFRPPCSAASVTYRVSDPSVLTLENNSSNDPLGKSHSVTICAKAPGTATLYYRPASFPAYCVLAVITVSPQAQQPSDATASQTPVTPPTVQPPEIGIIQPPEAGIIQPPEALPDPPAMPPSLIEPIQPEEQAPEEQTPEESETGDP